MSLFKRRKKAGRDSPQSIAGVPPDAVASEDFDVVVRQLITQMAGASIEELGDDSIRAAGTTTYLGNLRKGWNQRGQGEREVWLRNAIHGLFLSELRDKSTLDLSMLRPGIRSEWYLNVGPLMVAAQDPTQPITNDIAFRSLGPGLVRVLLWDTPTTMGLITDEQISDWGSDFDDLWTVAVQNLANDPVTEGWGRANDSAWMPVHADDYTAERIFVDGHVATTGLTGDMVMFHPNRGTLVLVDPTDAAGIDLGAKIALSRADDPNPISLLPYIGSGLSWRPLELAPDHPAAESVAQLTLSELQSSYAQQKELLAAIHGEDLFIATFQAFKVDDRILTVASWTEGAPSLLPKTDVISFVYGLDREEPVAFTVPWDAAEQIVGARLEPTAHWPQRFRVTTFPDANEIAHLHAASS